MGNLFGLIFGLDSAIQWKISFLTLADDLFPGKLDLAMFDEIDSFRLVTLFVDDVVTFKL